MKGDLEVAPSTIDPPMVANAAVQGRNFQNAFDSGKNRISMLVRLSRGELDLERNEKRSSLAHMQTDVYSITNHQPKLNELQPFSKRNVATEHLLI